MKKQLILILGALCITISLLGCGERKEQQTVKSNSKIVNQEQKDECNNPEQYIKMMYENSFDKDKRIDYEKVWDEYFSERSKELPFINRNDYIEEKKTNTLKNNVICNGIDIISSENIKDDVYKVHSVLKININGQDSTEEMYEYVIKENEKLKYLWNGILSVDELGNVTIENINYNNVERVNFADGLGIVVDVENKYDNPIALGWVNGPTIILKTDKGEYTSTLSPIKIDRGQTQTIEIKFEEAQGEIESITINNINYLNDRGLPIDHTGGASHTLQL